MRTLNCFRPMSPQTDYPLTHTYHRYSRPRWQLRHLSRRNARPVPVLRRQHLQLSEPPDSTHPRREKSVDISQVPHFIITFKYQSTRCLRNHDSREREKKTNHLISRLSFWANRSPLESSDDPILVAELQLPGHTRSRTVTWSVAWAEVMRIVHGYWGHPPEPF